MARSPKTKILGTSRPDLPCICDLEVGSTSTFISRIWGPVKVHRGFPYLKAGEVYLLVVLMAESRE